MANVARLIRSLSPLGPIFGKELRSTARRKRTYYLRFFYIAALLLVMLFCYSITSSDFRQVTSVARRAQKLAELGAIFFAVFAFFSLIAMAIAGPVLTATAINSERLHKTLPVLLMTPISAWQIVAGKLFSRLLIALTLLGLSLPILAIVRLLGGVEIEQMFGVICICVSIALFTAALGLLLSTLVSRAYAVILLAYATLGFIYFFIPLCIGMIISAIGPPSGPSGRSWEATLFQIAAIGHPGVATALLAIPERPPFRLVGWEWCALIHAGLAGILTLLAALSLRRIARREAEGAGPTPAAAAPPHVYFPPPPALAPTLAAAPAPAPSAATVQFSAAESLAPPALVPPPPARGASRAVADNPVLWRETRRPLFARRWQSIAAACVVLAILMFIYVLMSANNVLTEPQSQIPFAFIFCGILNILACVISATAIAQEKESDTWTLLMVTPLTARGIVIGKLLGILRRLAPLCLVITVHFLLFLICGTINPITFLVILYLTFTTNLIWVATGLFLSLKIKRVTFAVMLNLAGPLLLYLLPLVLLAIIFSSTPNDDVIQVVGLYCPYPYMASAISHYGSSYARSFWLPVYGAVPEEKFLVFVFLAGAAHLLVSAGIVYFTIRRFDRLVERAPQESPLAHPRPQFAAAPGFP
jgi:ABC-type transport system involved in multi-copper enzyme maturation permease subunit